MIPQSRFNGRDHLSFVNSSNMNPAQSVLANREYIFTFTSEKTSPNFGTSENQSHPSRNDKKNITFTLLGAYTICQKSI